MYFTFSETSNLFLFWTRKVKRVAVCLVYDMLSFIPIGLLHNIANVCNQNSLIVYFSFSAPEGGGTVLYFRGFRDEFLAPAPKPRVNRVVNEKKIIFFIQEFD